MRRHRLLRAAGLITAVVAATIGYLRLGPLPAGLLDLSYAESTEIVDRHGELLYEARSADGGRTSWLTSAELPRSLVDATLAAEDRRFYRHPGVDPIAIGRASLRNVKAGAWLEGGSTITQQVAKLLLARRESASGRRGLRAKLREAVVAVRLEHRLSKDEILALYLNLAPYGNQLTGADRASRAYFGHQASLLTPAQAAFLAALPQRPSSYNPYRDSTRARARQERVIAQMGASGALDAAAVRAAMDERLALAPEAATFLAPHFVARVLELVTDQSGLCPEPRLSRCAGAPTPHSAPSRARPARPFARPTRPTRIVTTLDASLQREVSGIIRAARPSLQRHGAHNVAAVVLDNATGEWLAWEGSGDYDAVDHGGQIDGATTPRQPGSALKPFTYALAFEEGESPSTVLPDVLSYFPTAKDGVTYSPRNYDNRFRGPMLARRALAGSANVPAVALASRVGVPNLLRFLRSAGLTTLEKTGAYYGLGVTLGDAEVRLDELVAAYSVFGRGGTAIEPTLIRRTAPPEPRSLMSPRTAFWITDILSDAEARAYAFGRGGTLEFPFAVAAKTGTSQAYHDNWAIGYTRDVTVGVWVGNFDRRPLIGSSGVTGAGPIFHAIMLAAVSRSSATLPDPWIPASVATPERTSRQFVCALSGLAASPECPQHVDEWVADDRPLGMCRWHRQTSRGVVVDWPAAYQAWAAGERLVDRVVGPPRPTASMVASDAAVSPAQTHPAPTAAASPLRVLSPPDGAVYLIDPTLRRSFQTLELRGAADVGTDLEWRVNGESIGTSEPGVALDWPLKPGRHVVTAHDQRGRQASASITVK